MIKGYKLVIIYARVRSMRIFDFNNYKEFVNKRIRMMPNKGRGQFQKISEHLRIHSSLVSQILSGERHLTSEQGCELAEYLGLNPLETDFLLNLIEEERAGSVKLRANLKRQREKMLVQAKALVSRFPKGTTLSDGNKAIYYSHWYYSAILLLIQIPGFDTADIVTEKLALSALEARTAIEFLVSVGLMSEKNGKLQCLQSWMAVPKHSTHVLRHHTNWRLKAVSHLQKNNDTDISFTAPVTLSKKDARLLKEKLEAWISEMSVVVKESPSEKLMCLNLDFFEVA